MLDLKFLEGLAARTLIGTGASIRGRRVSMKELQWVGSIVKVDVIGRVAFMLREQCGLPA